MILSFLFLPQGFVGREAVITGWGAYSIYAGISLSPFTWHNIAIGTYILSIYLAFIISIIAICTEMTKRQKFIIKVVVSILVILSPIQLLIAYFPRIGDVDVIFNSIIPLPPINLMLDGYILGLILLWTYKPSTEIAMEKRVSIFRQIELDPNLKKKFDELLKIYEAKYPHNPEGVLRYHLSKEFKLVNDLSLALSRLKEKSMKSID